MTEPNKYRFKDGERNVTAVLYADNSTSCNCRNWTRKTGPDGSRECEHTKRIKKLNPAARSRTEPYKVTQGQVAISIPANTPVTITSTPGTKVTVTSPGEDRGVRRKFNWG